MSYQESFNRLLRFFFFLHTQGHLNRLSQLSQLAFENKTLLLHHIIHMYTSIISIFNYQRSVIK